VQQDLFASLSAGGDAGDPGGPGRETLHLGEDQVAGLEVLLRRHFLMRGWWGGGEASATRSFVLEESEKEVPSFSTGLSTMEVF
jgi:hypothetical protein